MSARVQSRLARLEAGRGGRGWVTWEQYHAARSPVGARHAWISLTTLQAEARRAEDEGRWMWGAYSTEFLRWAEWVLNLWARDGYFNSAEMVEAERLFEEYCKQEGSDIEVERERAAYGFLGKWKFLDDLEVADRAPYNTWFRAQKSATGDAWESFQVMRTLVERVHTLKEWLKAQTEDDASVHDEVMS